MSSRITRYHCHMDHGHIHDMDSYESHAGGGTASKDRTYLAYMYDHVGGHRTELQEIAERIGSSMGDDVAQELNSCMALLGEAQECLHRTIHLLEGRE